jgi:hypothetical protein
MTTLLLPTAVAEIVTPEIETAVLGLIVALMVTSLMTEVIGAALT